ncbi:MAG: c-type cytochrome [Bdellovibrionales bacterium]|nr:c-type cytochrome [Bdellovibrionales bacterium]
MFKLIVLAGIVFGALMPAEALEDKELGEKLALQGKGVQITACTICHGAKGEGQAAAGFPFLAGLGEDYLYNQLVAFKTLKRVNAVMQPIATALSKKEMRALARYYSSLDGPKLGVLKDTTNEVGQWLFERGKWSQSVPSCMSCHGKSGSGIGAAIPRITGQGLLYIKTQLQAFHGQQRQGEADGIMSHIAQKLTEEEIDAVAHYVAGVTLKTVRKEETPKIDSVYFQPQSESNLKDDKFSQMVQKGIDIVMDTPKHAREFVKNDLTCANCHINRGRNPWAIPLWASFAMYPAYRDKNDMVNSMADRLQGCFVYSHNGSAPPADSEILKALEAYQYWLGQGTIVGKDLEGRRVRELNPPKKTRSLARGKRIYLNRCAICHGKDGSGIKGESRDHFPALWGDNSFNWGAGMHRLNTSAGFIKENMPLGKADLTEQEAWDVALYVNSHQRPEDPRFEVSKKATAKKFHDHDCQYNK